MSKIQKENMRKFWSDKNNANKIEARNKKISKKLTGIKKSRQHIINNSKSHIGNTWEKIYGEKVANQLKKQYKARLKQNNPMKIRGGWSEEERRILSERFKGRIPWNKGKTGLQKNINISGLQKGRGWNKGIKNGKYITCKVCGEKKYIKKNHYEKSSSKVFFCGNKCKFIYLRLEKSPLWRGGKSFEPYDKTFNNVFKRAIRKRDNQICMLCGIHREKLNKALHIHHINYDKLLSIPQNCISLCLCCHMKTNHNRKNWTKFFMSILKDKYNYSYSEELEPIIDINIAGNNNV